MFQCPKCHSYDVEMTPRLFKGDAKPARAGLCHNCGERFTTDAAPTLPHINGGLDHAPMLPAQEVARLRRENARLLRDLGSVQLDNVELQQRNADLLCEIDCLTSELRRAQRMGIVRVLRPEAVA